MVTLTKQLLICRIPLSQNRLKILMFPLIQLKMFLRPPQAVLQSFYQHLVLREVLPDGIPHLLPQSIRAVGGFN